MRFYGKAKMISMLCLSKIYYSYICPYYTLIPQPLHSVLHIAVNALPVCKIPFV